MYFHAYISLRVGWWRIATILFIRPSTNGTTLRFEFIKAIIVIKCTNKPLTDYVHNSVVCCYNRISDFSIITSQVIASMLLFVLTTMLVMYFSTGHLTHKGTCAYMSAPSDIISFRVVANCDITNPHSRFIACEASSTAARTLACSEVRAAAWVRVSVCVRVSMCVYVRVTYTNTHTKKHTHTCARTHTRTHTCTHTCTRAHIHTHTHARTRISTHTHTQTHIHIHIHTQAQAHTQTQTHTHT